MAIDLKGALSGALAEVEATSKALRTRLYGASAPMTGLHGADARTMEGVMQLANNDGNARILRADRFGGLALAQQTPLLHEPFEGATLSASRFVATATTMAAVQAATGLTINSGAINTINTGYVLASRKLHPRIMRAPLQFKTRLRAAWYANSVMEFGYGSGNSATASPNVGAYFQITAGGVFQGVVTYNGVDTTVALPGFTNNINQFFTYDILLDDENATFIVQDTATGLILSEATIPLPLSQGRLANVTHLPHFWSVRITGVATATPPQMIVTDGYVGLLDMNLNTPWAQRIVQMGGGSNYNPTTFAQASNGANSAAPTAATLANATAGYATLGGRFGFAAVAGAVTDYPLFAFTVPSPYQFVCTGVDIETYNTGAAVATTAHLFDWSIGVNGASANLGTGAHIRCFIGAQSLPVAAAIGAKAERISTPPGFMKVCEAGLNLAIILRMPVATATASQVIQGGVAIHGFFE
jgi:hypothetical protein